MFVLALLVMLVALLLPTGYVLLRMWQTSEDNAGAAMLERTGVSYLQPLTKLLSSVIDAQSAAARGQIVDTDAVRAATEEVTRVDRTAGDELLARQRWAPLPEQIESAMSKALYGTDALNAYAVPIGLTQTLLAHVGATSGALRDTDLVAYSLVDGAVFLLPEAMVNASRIVALVRSGAVQTSAIAIAHDRITRSVTDLVNGLQLGASAGGLAQLTRVDNFTAAVLAMTKASTKPDMSAAALVELDAAEARLQSAALTLAAGLLTELDSRLELRTRVLSEEHLRINVATSVATLAAAGLLGVCLAAVGRRRKDRVVSRTESPTTSLEPPGLGDQPRMSAVDGGRLSSSRGAPIRQGTAPRGQGAR